MITYFTIKVPKKKLIMGPAMKVMLTLLSLHHCIRAGNVGICLYVSFLCNLPTIIWTLQLLGPHDVNQIKLIKMSDLIKVNIMKTELFHCTSIHKINRKKYKNAKSTKGLTIIINTTELERCSCRRKWNRCMRCIYIV